MKIVILQGSSHQNGSSNYLAEKFAEGATTAGHDIHGIDVAHSWIQPCLGCDACGMSGPCCQKDDMADIKNKLPRRIWWYL